MSVGNFTQSVPSIYLSPSSSLAVLECLPCCWLDKSGISPVLLDGGFGVRIFPLLLSLSLGVHWFMLSSRHLRHTRNKNWGQEVDSSTELNQHQLFKSSGDLPFTIWMKLIHCSLLEPQDIEYKCWRKQSSREDTLQLCSPFYGKHKECWSSTVPYIKRNFCLG